MFRLAGQQPPEPRSPLAHVDPAMIYLLGVLGNTPAQVADDLLTVVAQNRAAENLLGVWTGRSGYESNVTWRWFADPASRDSNDPAEHERIGRAYAADLRETFKRFEPTNRYVKKFTGLLSERRRNAERAIHNFSLLVQELSKKDTQLAQLVEHRFELGGDQGDLAEAEGAHAVVNLGARFSTKARNASAVSALAAISR